ncbi:MAG: toxin-antitoxin system YwqK family antitoxin [Flavobacteriales bacterium]|nr:toxin-antitoxin system YwqK family antitoxin [Flavobacteriales bacterium]
MCVEVGVLSAQVGDGFHQYFYPDGKVSSEGILVDGKPEGHWKTFYETGVLKSEGNRVDFQLDSTWSFHAPDGSLTSTIEYKDGKKNGPSRTYAPGDTLVSEENYVADVKEGPSIGFFPDGTKRSTVEFKDGKEEAKAYEYAEDGRIITITDWRAGVLQRRQAINRYDAQHLRQGPWQGYWSNGRLKWEGRFVDDKRQGIFKEYDQQGNLQDLAKFDQDEVLPDATETTLLDIKNTYHSNGAVASIGSYSKDGKKEGLFRRFDAKGKPTDASIFRNNVLVSEGEMSEVGAMTGPWTEFYSTGEKRAEGQYKEGKKDGPWTFYHRSSEVEQKGNYLNGLPQSNWKWYYRTGELHREENYRKGKEEGASVEYEKDGIVII